MSEKSELRQVIEGLEILERNGASGLIGAHDQVKVVGAKVPIGRKDTRELELLGFYWSPPHFAKDL